MSRYKDIDLCTKIIKKEFSSIESSGVSMYKKGRRDGLVLANGILRDDKRIPAADVVEVKHGEWQKHYKSGTTVSDGFVSSCCDMWNERKTPYCPQCGAKMDGREKNE